MITPDALKLRLSRAIDRDAAVALLREAIHHDSVTGHEGDFAHFLARELEALDADRVTLREFAPARPNVWATRRGSGGGRRLMFVGHTDTVHAHGWRERWASDPREDPWGAPVLDGEIWGRGAGDLKAGICTVLLALRALDRAGLRLEGDVVCAFVGDEESGEPGSGVSAGIKALIPLLRSGEVPPPDFAVYVEPTQLNVYAAQMGFLILDVRIQGKSAYFGVPELGIDALKGAHAVLSELWRYSDQLGVCARHPLVGSAFLLVTSIAGGGSIAVPGACSLSLIRKLLPSETLSTAREELESVIRSALGPGLTVEFNYPAGRDHPVGGTPYETDPTQAPIEMLCRSLARVAPAHGQIEGAPYWSEASFLASLGIPTVYCAPGDIRNCHTHEERVSVDEFLSAIEAFGLFMAEFCGVEEID